MRFELTFDIKDITDEVQKKVVFVAHREDDMVTAITEEGQEYLFEFSGFAPRKVEQAVLERFLGERVEIDAQNADLKEFRENGKWLYKWLPFAFVYVRKDFFDRFISEFEKQEERRYLSALNTARMLLNPQGKVPPMIYPKPKTIYEADDFNMEEQRKKEVDEILKETERKLEEKSYEEHFMSLEDFKKRMRDKISELEEQDGQ